MQQLYAKIKLSSKYAYQNQSAIEQGYGCPFPVTVTPNFDDYCVVGGPGSQYRLADVNLFVIENSKQIRIR